MSSDDRQIELLGPFGAPRDPDGDDLVHDVHFGDNLEVLAGLPDGSVDLIYIDPPFNTGQMRRHTRLRVKADEGASRGGFGGQRYRVEKQGTMAYPDYFDDYIGWLAPRLEEAYRVMADHATLYLHLDWREAARARLCLDRLFGREGFVNEIIWAYDFGGRSKRRWPRKHDNILMYAKDPDGYTFNREAVDRIPYMAPGLVSEEKRERGKFPTDVWWHTIVPTSGSERTGYPTQKPLGVLRRIVAASSSPGDTVLDFFAGSGTTGAACLELGRRFVLADDNPEAIEVMMDRFGDGTEIRWHNWPPTGAA